MNLQGMMFDLDGTLGDTFQVIFPAYRQALNKYLGRAVADEEIQRLFGPTEEGILQQMVPDHWQECLQEYLSIYRQISPSATRHFPGIEQALLLLRQRGVKLGVITGKGQESALISLHDLGIAPFFDLVEGGAAQGVIKPECMRGMLKQWNLQPSQAAYVGDAAMDMENAREVGLLPLAAAWCDLADASDLSKQNPYAIFHDLPSFIRWLDENIAKKNGHMSPD